MVGDFTLAFQLANMLIDLADIRLEAGREGPDLRGMGTELLLNAGRKIRGVLVEGLGGQRLEGVAERLLRGADPVQLVTVRCLFGFQLAQAGFGIKVGDSRAECAADGEGGHQRQYEEQRRVHSDHCLWGARTAGQYGEHSRPLVENRLASANSQALPPVTPHLKANT